MSKTVKSIGSVFGLDSSTKIKPQIADKNLFDISQEVKPAQEQYQPLLQASQANQAAVAPLQTQALTQQGLAATGQGPSLAEMQLKAAQDRGFAQQLAAAQSQRAASPALAQRQLLLNMGNANRDLAQQSAIARLQERDAFLNQANNVNQNLRTDIAGNLNLALQPKQSLQNWEMARVGAVNQAQAANAQQAAAKQGALLSGLGSIAGAAFAPASGPISSLSSSNLALLSSDKKNKKDIKPAEQDMEGFLKALSAKNYEYKDEAAPGAAPGERYGIMAQDLEKSKVGSSLVKETSNGKVVDPAQAIGTILAAQAHLHKKVEALSKGEKTHFGHVLKARKKKD